MVIQYKRGLWSIERPITSDCSERRHTYRTGKLTIKNEQCGRNRPKGIPQVNSHSTWILASQGGYRWQMPIVCEDVLRTSNASFPAPPEGGYIRLGGRMRPRQRRTSGWRLATPVRVGTTVRYAGPQM